MPMPGVCAVVVTHNRREMLRRCLGALARQTTQVDRVVVIDNASIDGTADLVRDEFPDAELLRLEKNAGGAGGFHAGMKRAAAQDFDALGAVAAETIASEAALRG